MKSSLIHHCKLTTRSAAVFLGTTEGEIYRIFDNNPPAFLSLAELHKLAGDKIKSGERDSMWFNSDLAQKDPILVHTVEQLLDIIKICLPVPYSELLFQDLSNDFTQLIGLKPSIGTAIEVLRIIVGKYEYLTGEISLLVERLSMRGFFEI